MFLSVCRPAGDTEEVQNRVGGETFTYLDLRSVVSTRPYVGSAFNANVLKRCLAGCPCLSSGTVCKTYRHDIAAAFVTTLMLPKHFCNRSISSIVPHSALIVNYGVFCTVNIQTANRLF